MLNISKALNAQAVQTYHKQFTSEIQNYYKQGSTVQGEWQGQLAERYGLSGPVSAEDFALLAEGKHPQTGQELVKHRTAQEYIAADGRRRRQSSTGQAGMRRFPLQSLSR